MPISHNVHVMTSADLEAIKTEAFLRGVERGRIEERLDMKKERVAMNCANWKDGVCEHCGVQHQHFEVGSDYKCPHFTIKPT